jgi:hypothetical protein
MKNTISFCLIFLLTIMLGWSLGTAAEVSQGKCLQYDKEKKSVTIDEYDLNFSKENPYGLATGQTSTYDLTTALVGIIPEPGDILRIAYVMKGTDRVAIKVMNVSKQDLRKK